jgi:hypothetical protein
VIVHQCREEPKVLVMAFLIEKGWIELMTKPIVNELVFSPLSQNPASTSVNHSNLIFLFNNAASRTFPLLKVTNGESGQQ